jgi:hypothetical protein
MRNAGEEETGQHSSIFMNKIAAEIAKIREELDELAGHLPDWEQYSESHDGSKKYRGLAHRIYLSAQRLESIVRESTR